MNREPQGTKAAALRERLSGIIAPLVFLFVVALVLAIAARHEGFLTRQNWRTIFQSTAVVAIIAVGETAVIISGQIDLSVGRVMALSAVVAAWAMKIQGYGLWVGVLAACATGAACGLVNGSVTAFLRMPSFIATLGMMGVAYGLVLLLSGGSSISGSAPGFEYFSMGEVFGTHSREGIPVPLVLIVATAIVGHLLLSRTSWGRRVYAVGGNRDAARLSGVSLNRMTITTFLLCGTLCGLAAVIYVSLTGGAQPNAGVSFELKSIAAAVIGGTSLAGGVGGIPGTLIGALLMALIQNGCELKGVGPYWQPIIEGGVVWLAASYDAFRRRGTR